MFQDGNLDFRELTLDDEKVEWKNTLYNHYAHNPHHPEYFYPEDTQTGVREKTKPIRELDSEDGLCYLLESILDMLASRGERFLKDDPQKDATEVLQNLEDYEGVMKALQRATIVSLRRQLKASKRLSRQSRAHASQAKTTTKKRKRKGDSTPKAKAQITSKAETEIASIRTETPRLVTACSFSCHTDGLGKPPVDETRKPLYGDVFGTTSAEFETETGPDDTGLVTHAEGFVTLSGMSSVPVGMETPRIINVHRIEDAMDQGGETPVLYQVIPEKKTSAGGAMMGSTHVPVGAKMPREKGPTEVIEVALRSEELHLDTAKYNQTLWKQQSHQEKEDISDMVAEHDAKQKLVPKLMRKKQEESGKASLFTNDVVKKKQV
ncbi:SF3B2-like protein [Mya arenaria]|uniref:SF3B2-like protein n=1 Tax=Mya arenaria TaxID=6604 RepID=A0ABY7FD66_MYAAR|nr:SF3B2-like protein [Mya arenaria]